MKLSDLPRGQWFRIASNPEAGPFKLDHRDSQYYICWSRCREGYPHTESIHMLTDVIPIDNPYEEI